MGKGGGGEVKETAAEREAARIAAERWNIYKENYIPLENEFMRLVRPTEATGEVLASRTGGAIEKQREQALGVHADDAVARNIRPDSGAFLSGMEDVEEAHTESRAAGQASARGRLADLHYAGLESIVNLGQGVAQSGQIGLDAAAGRAVGDAINTAESDLMDSAGLQYAVGAGVGAASQASGLGLKRQEAVPAAAGGG